MSVNMESNVSPEEERAEGFSDAMPRKMLTARDTHTLRPEIDSLCVQWGQTAQNTKGHASY